MNKYLEKIASTAFVRNALADIGNAPKGVYDKWSHLVIGKPYMDGIKGSIRKTVQEPLTNKGKSSLSKFQNKKLELTELAAGKINEAAR